MTTPVIKFNKGFGKFKFVIYTATSGGVFHYTTFELWTRKPKTTLWLFNTSLTLRTLLCK